MPPKGKLSKSQLEKLKRKVMKFKELPLVRALELKKCAQAIGDPDDDWARYAMWQACIAALGLDVETYEPKEEPWKGKKRKRRIRSEMIESMCVLLERRLLV